MFVIVRLPTQYLLADNNITIRNSETNHSKEEQLVVETMITSGRSEDVLTSAVSQDAVTSLYSLILTLMTVSAAKSELSVDHPQPYSTNLYSQGPSPPCYPAYQSYSVTVIT